MTVDWKKKLLPNLPYLLFVYLFDKLCQAVRLAPGLDASEKFLHLSQGFTEAFSYATPSLHPLDLLLPTILFHTLFFHPFFFPSTDSFNQDASLLPIFSTL